MESKITNKAKTLYIINAIKN